MTIKIKSCKFKIDKEDEGLVKQHKWYSNGKYICTYVKGKTTYIHRLIMNPPKGLEVDHINGDRYDNRRCNLRICTRSQNNANWKGKHRPGSSRYRGVCWRKDTKIWKTEVQIDKKRLNLGCFKNEKEAAHTYDVVAKQLFGEFAYLNFGDN